MKLSCLHTHTTFCDGQDDIDTICKAAYEKNFVSLGFSSHAPIPKEMGETEWHIKNDMLESYLEAVLKAKKNWEGKLRIFLGLEIDYIEGISGPHDARFQNLGLDYSIGSVHYVVPPNGAKAFTVDGPFEEAATGIKEGFGGDAKAYVHAYWKAVSNMIEHGGFDILGHIDLIKKNNQNEEFFSFLDTDYRNGAENAVKKLAGTSIVAEINTGGLNRRKTKDCYPSLEILKMMKVQNIPLAITADAHRAEDICGFYNTASITLKEAAYTSIQFFEGKHNGEAQAKWSALPLD
jgi:histidinol-phosphatase (PHP family)